MRKHRKSAVKVLLATIVLTVGMSVTAFAYDRLDYQPGRQHWRWEDWNDDGVYECYYYKDNGNRGFSLFTTPDGYELNQEGQWTINGVVQTRTKEESTKETVEITSQQVQIDYSAYDPEHPLANVVDAWNLRLPNEELGASEVSASSIQALLTNQMDYYNYLDIANYAPLIDGMYTATRNGTTFYVREEDYKNNKILEQDLYNWYCNWLNSFDFQHMSEMEKAREIQKILGSAKYVDGTAGGFDHGILIEKQGQCEDFAMTACSLATALGLKSTVSGYGNHAIYYIWIDGECYMGSNQEFNLEYPSDLNNQKYWVDGRW